MRFVVYDPNDMPRVWKRVEPLIARACAHSDGEMTPESVLDGVLSGRFGLLGIEGEGEQIAAAIVEIVQQPDGRRVMWIKAAGGRDSSLWIEFDDEIDALAAGFGCSVLRMLGRKGWVRRLSHWRMTHVVLERPVG